MKYCPICDKKLKPDGRCSCGYDPSLDYESYLTLGRIKSGEAGTNETKEPVSVAEVSSVNETSKYARNNCNYEDIDPKDAGIMDIFNMDFSTFPTNSEEQEGIWN